MIAANRFRRDLYYRVAGFTLRVPPLRARRGDIPAFVEHFMRLYAEGALVKASEFAATSEIRDLGRLFEARVRLEEEDVATAAQLADGALKNLMVQCRVDCEACAWVPLAEWVLGQALSSAEGREDEAKAILARPAEHAPGTWIATSLTQ